MLRVLGARTIAENEEFDVRLADLSPSGVAFVTEHRFTIGDRFAIMATVGGRVLRMQAWLPQNERLALRAPARGLRDPSRFEGRFPCWLR